MKILVNVAFSKLFFYFTFKEINKYLKLKIQADLVIIEVFVASYTECKNWFVVEFQKP